LHIEFVCVLSSPEQKTDKKTRTKKDRDKNGTQL